MAFLDNTGVAKLCALIKEKYDNLKSLIAGKQDALTAGANISINNGVISAVDTDTTYTAGTGISIDANNEISCTVSGGSYDGISQFGTDALPSILFWDAQTYVTYSANGNQLQIQPSRSADVKSASNEEVPYWQALREGRAVQIYASGKVYWKDILEEIFGPKDDIPTWDSCAVWRIRRSNGMMQFDSQPWIIYNKNTDLSTITSNINVDWMYIRIGKILYCFNPNDTTSGQGTPRALELLRERYCPWLTNAIANAGGSSLPAAPSTDGNYLLKCSVSSGTPTYSWESVTIGGSY